MTLRSSLPTINSDSLRPESKAERKQDERKKNNSAFMRVLPQILAATAKNTLAINFGLSIGFQTIAIPALSIPNNDIHMTKDDISWFGSLFLLSIPFGCILSGPCIHRWGRKSVMLLLCIPFFIVWWIYYCATSTWMMFLGMITHGLINGLLEAPILTYVAEISEPKWRGMLSSSSAVAALLGIFLEFLIGNYMSWRKAAMVNSIFPVLSFVTICFVPESPHWLASVGRHKKAEKSLRWLRGWVSSEDVKEEFQELVSAHTKTSQSSKAPTSWKAYTHRTFIKPFLLEICAFAVGHLSGMATIQTYAVSIFESFGVPGYKWTAMLGITQVLGSLVCLICLPFLGKRPIAIISMLGTAIGLLTASLYKSGGIISSSFILVANFFTNACSRVIPWIIIGEIFTNELRAVASGIVSCFGYALGFVMLKTYLYFLDLMTLKWMLVGYGGFAVAGALLYFFCLPETEGKTLVEVQEHYAKKGKDNLAFTPA